MPRYVTLMCRFGKEENQFGEDNILGELLNNTELPGLYIQANEDTEYEVEEIIFDLSSVEAAAASKFPGCTWVVCKTGNTYMLELPYAEFKAQLLLDKND